MKLEVRHIFDDARADLVVVKTIEETGCPSDLSYERETEWLKDWLARNGAAYYAAPREEFSLHAARMLAVAEGKTTVVVEDLS